MNNIISFFFILINVGIILFYEYVSFNNWSYLFFFSFCSIFIISIMSRINLSMYYLLLGYILFINFNFLYLYYVGYLLYVGVINSVEINIALLIFNRLFELGLIIFTIIVIYKYYNLKRLKKLLVSNYE